MNRHVKIWLLPVGLVAVGLAAAACSLPGVQRASSGEMPTPYVVTATPEETIPSQQEATETDQPSSGADTADATPQELDEEVVTTEEVSGAVAQAQANEQVNIRERPGADCPIIGFVPDGTVIDLQIRTTSPTQYWYQTDYLGEDQPGWVYHGPLTLLNDDSELPREPEHTCSYCGDGTCSSEYGETCETCAEDCGVCPTCGDGVVNQASEQCDGGGCGAGYSCNASCQCVRDAYCGDGSVNQSSEECDGGGCDEGYTCNASCQCEQEEEEAYCGDGSVNQTWEECDGGGCDTGYSCNTSCQCVQDAYCGDGLVNQDWEECDPPGSSCGSDDYVCVECVCAGVIRPAYCGDGICNEDPCSCEEDCGPC